MTNNRTPRPIVQSEETVILVGGGSLNTKDLTLSLAFGQTLVAADGGAAPILKYGKRPVAVIGDMDSVPDDPRLEGLLYPVPEQDSTDFSKCLSRIEAPLILAVGFGAGRLDHVLAVLTTLAHYPEKPVVVLSGESLAFLAPPALSLPLSAGTVVSLWPLGEVRAKSDGLRWPLDGLVFRPDGQVGTSNEAMGAVRLEVEAPLMLVILPREELGLVMKSLAGVGSPWPARAPR